MKEAAALAVLLCLAPPACGLDPTVLVGRPCGAAGTCAEGYACDPGSWTCVPRPGASCSPEGLSAPCGRAIGICTTAVMRCIGGRWSTCDAVGARQERCDGLDDDCDGLTDEDFSSVGQACRYTAGGCDLPGRTVCDDRGAVVCHAEPGPERCDGLDNDCDGVTDNLDADSDGWFVCGSLAVDCDDQRADTYPGAPERCDGRDNDCDGRSDEAFIEVDWQCSAGVGACRRTLTYLCVAGELFCPATPGPASDEVCDGQDNDCDGQTDEDVAQVGVPCAVGLGACRREGSWQCLGPAATCSVEPGPPLGETCNDVDDDCDGLTDDVDADSDGHFGCPYWLGQPGARFDCDDTRATVHAGALEVCDGRDNDCDGATDDLDADSDGRFGCPFWLTRPGGLYDCDDTRATVHVGAPEICDGLDNDCDEATADGASDPLLGAACDGPDGDWCLDDVYDGCDGGQLRCAAGATNLEGRTAGDTCRDGIDNDCDGLTDRVEELCWWDHDWARRVKIVFANGTGAQSLDSFPVLVTLTTDSFTGQDLPGSLRFVDADDVTVLSHEVERWLPGGQSVLWVRVPRIDAGSATDHVWLYWDNGAISGAAPDPRLVWDSSFAGVWHLGEQTGAAHLDSTSNANHGSAGGTSQSAGYVGYAQAFGSASTVVSVPHSSSLDLAGPFSIELLAYADNPVSYPDLLVKGSYNGGYSLIVYGAYEGAPAYPAGFVGAYGVLAASVLPASSWRYLACTWDGTTSRIYVNGVLSGSRTEGPGPTQNSLALTFSSASWPLSGRLDEVRISTGRRSDAWIEAQHRSMQGLLAVVGSHEAWRDDQ